MSISPVQDRCFVTFFDKSLCPNSQKPCHEAVEQLEQIKSRGVWGYVESDANFCYFGARSGPEAAVAIRKIMQDFCRK
jgi:hypothetical protein